MEQRTLTRRMPDWLYNHAMPATCWTARRGHHVDWLAEFICHLQDLAKYHCRRAAITCSVKLTASGTHEPGG